MMSMINRYKLFLLIIALSGLVGCQPPLSGEATHWKRPYLEWKLRQDQLEFPLPIPVKGIMLNQIQDTWGAARGAGRKHEGVDIFAKRGTAVLSSTQGIVRTMNQNRLGGTVIWIIGPNATLHYYAHLEDYAAHIQEGDWVEVGETIGYVGNSGNAINTPPHLHYGIYTSHGAVNPYLYLAGVNTEIN